MPFEGLVPVRRAKARQIGHVRQLPECGRLVERPLERRAHPAQGGLRHALDARSPARRKGTVCLRTHTRDGADPRPLSAASGVGPSPQRGTRRQPAREPGTVDSPTTDRHQGQRCHRVGARNTCSIYRSFGHLQQCSRSLLSTLGGGGNRTRVLQYLTRASPGAACSAFLSPGDHAS
jgi:hypothetical protein